jgi:hypothetical protein
MKTTKLTMMAMMAAMTFTACSNDDETGNTMFTPEKGEIVLMMEHPGQVTRATETAFEAKDEIGVYVTRADAALQLGGNEVNNELFAYNGTSWTSRRKVYWNEGQHSVYAYYPYSPAVNDVSNYDFSVSEDQSTQAAYSKSDFLWAGKEGVVASSSPVTMKFAHKMSSVVVRLKKGENFDGSIPSDTKVFLYGTVTKASIDLSTGDVSKDNYAGTSSIGCLKRASDEFEAIVVPQNITSRRPLVEVVAGGVSYLMEGKMSYKPGVRHTLSVTLDKNPEKVKIEIGSSIEGW